MKNSIPAADAGEPCKTNLKKQKRDLSQGTQETQKNQICSIETKILNSLRPLREDDVFVVCLMSVQNKNGKGKFISSGVIRKTSLYSLHLDSPISASNAAWCSVINGSIIISRLPDIISSSLYSVRLMRWSVTLPCGKL